MFQYFVIFCLFVVASCENCSEDFDKFYRCVDQSKNLKHEKSFKKTNQRKSEIIDCFVKNSCTREPTFDNSYHPPSEDEEKLEQDRKRRQECREQVQQKIRESISKCVQENITGFHLPNNTKEEFKKSYTMESIRNQIQPNCPNPDSQPVVNKCLDDLESKRKSSSVNEYQKRLKRHCDLSKDCLKVMTAECQKQYNISKNLTCDCAEEKKKTEPEPLAKMYHDCVGSSAAKPDDKASLTSIIIAKDFDRICDKVSCSNVQAANDEDEEDKGNGKSAPQQTDNSKPKPTGLPIRRNAKRVNINQ